MQYFSGALYYTCRVGPDVPWINPKVWTKYSDTDNEDAGNYTGVCTPIDHQIFPTYMAYATCPEGSVCGSPYNATGGCALDLYEDGILSNA